MNSKDITCKVVLVGNSGVGKTSIIQRYIDGSYDPESEPTITTTYCYKKLNFPNIKNQYLSIYGIQLAKNIIEL